MNRRLHRANLDEAISRRQERRARWEREGERPLALNLAMIGALGWLIVVPTLVGLFIGRALDRQFGTDLTLTAALMLVGLVIGCRLAWSRMHQD